MGLIQDALRKIKMKREDKEDYERQRYIEENFEEKKKTADDRELEHYQEEARRKRVKALVKAIKKKKDRAFWSGKQNNPAYAKNFIVGQKNLFKGNNNLYLKPNEDNTKRLFYK